MASLNLVQIATGKLLWCTGLVVSLLVVFTSAFPIRVGPEYDTLEREDYLNNPVQENKRAQSAALWFQRNGKKSDTAGLDPFDRFLRDHSADENDGTWYMPPIWFHISGKVEKAEKGKPVPSPAPHQTRNLQEQLTPKDNKLLNYLLEQAKQR